MTFFRLLLCEKFLGQHAHGGSKYDCKQHIEVVDSVTITSRNLPVMLINLELPLCHVMSEVNMCGC